MLVDIYPLTQLDPDDLHRLITGYTSLAYYRVHTTETDEAAVFTLELIPFETPYVKQYPPLDEETLHRYDEAARLGFSLGAYDGGQLVSIALAERLTWNNSLSLLEFHVAPDYRGRGVGRRMIEELALRSHEAGLRVIVCETQNTNVPAIRFYRKAGFKLDGMRLSYYRNSIDPSGEFALFMTRVV